MKRTLRTLEERSSTQNNEFYYYENLSLVKRIKEDQQYLRKNNRNDDKSKIEKELNALKLEVSKIQTENKEMRNMNDDLNKEAKSLKIENEEVKKLNKSLEKHLSDITIENEALKIENKALAVQLSKEEEFCVPLVSDDDESAAKFVEVHNSNQEGNLFNWQRVNTNIEYNLFQKKIKRYSEVENELEHFIEENVWEDTFESYIREAMKILFTKKFFLKSISYKNEMNRVCVRGSKILKCLEKCLQKKFEKELKAEVGDVQDVIQESIQRFKRHVKSTPSLWLEEE